MSNAGRAGRGVLDATRGSNMNGSARIDDYWGGVVLQGRANGAEPHFSKSETKKYSIKQDLLGKSKPLLQYEPTLVGSGGGGFGQVSATATIEVVSIKPDK